MEIRGNFETVLSPVNRRISAEKEIPGIILAHKQFEELSRWQTRLKKRQKLKDGKTIVLLDTKDNLKPYETVMYNKDGTIRWSTKFMYLSNALDDFNWWINKW